MSNHSLKIPLTVGLLWEISSGGLFRECPVCVFCSTIVFFLVLIAKKTWLIAVWFKISDTFHWVSSGHYKLPSSSKYRGLNHFQHASVASCFHLLCLEQSCPVPREEQKDCHALNLLVVSWLLMFYLNLSFCLICSLAFFFCNKNSEFCCASKAKRKSYSSDVDDKMWFVLLSTNNNY